METVLAVLMAIGIFVGVPVLVGLTVIGIYFGSQRRIRRKERIETTESTKKIPELVETGKIK
ncbi:MAG: hypothetical protein JW762_00600 [Dehalococcoidales bacterium]|nr:hypothetical protein [Dehalococcoidales bacterium]